MLQGSYWEAGIYQEVTAFLKSPCNHSVRRPRSTKNLVGLTNYKELVI